MSGGSVNLSGSGRQKSVHIKHGRHQNHIPHINNSDLNGTRGASVSAGRRQLKGSTAEKEV